MTSALRRLAAGASLVLLIALHRVLAPSPPPVHLHDQRPVVDRVGTGLPSTPTGEDAQLEAASVTATSSPAPTTTTTTAPPAPPPLVPAWAMAAWSKVNICEEGGNWHVQGSVYSGGLGISETNWYAYGGQRDFGDEWVASPEEQVAVAMRINGSYVPDQGGCTGGW